MTLRQFVDSGTCGTREDRKRFEHMLLVAWADANEHGIKTDPNADIDPEMWQMFYETTKQWRFSMDGVIGRTVRLEPWEYKWDADGGISWAPEHAATVRQKLVDAGWSSPDEIKTVYRVVHGDGTIDVSPIDPKMRPQ